MEVLWLGIGIIVGGILVLAVFYQLAKSSGGSRGCFAAAIAILAILAAIGACALSQ